MKSNRSGNAPTTLRTPDPPRFTAEQCDALFAAVLVHDDIHPDAELPGAIHLDYSREQLASCFWICRQIWEEGVNREAFAAVIRKIGRHRSLGPEDQLYFKHARARFKHLRAVFTVIDERHRPPGALQAITAVMGFLQDAFKNDRAAAMSAWGVVLRVLLTRLPCAVVVRSIDGFRAGSAESFRQYVGSEIRFMRESLAREKITSKEFHEMRKVVSRQVALYDTLKTLYPSACHSAVCRYLSTINGMMGGMHDDLIVRKFGSPQGYYADAFELPEEIRRRLQALVDGYAQHRQGPKAARSQ